MRKWICIAAITALTIFAVVRVASTHRVFSATVDEPIHLGAGYQWYTGRYAVDVTHPPFSRIFFALPLRIAGFPVPQPGGMIEYGNQLLYHGDRYVKTLARGRIGNLLFLILANVVVAAWARRTFSRGVAVASVAMFTSLPLVLAHAGLMTTDFAIAATLPLAFLALDWYLDAPTLRRGALLGGAVALAFLSKFSFVLFFPAGAVIIIALRWPPRLSVRSVAIAIVTMLLVTWGMYRFSILKPADVVHNGADMIEWAAPDPLKPLARRIAAMPLPAAELFVGMAEVKLHDMMGHNAYLLGEEYQHGRWMYFPVLFFYKTPLPWLMFAAWGTGLILFRRDKRAAQYVLTAVAILGISMTGNINIGARHILPMFVPLSIVAGYAVIDIWTRSRDAFGRAALTGLLAWLFIGVAIAHPDYLSWFNEAARPNPSKIAIDSNLEWGQDLLRLARVVRQRQIGHLHYAMMSAVRLPEHGVQATPLTPHQPVTGWVAAGEHTLRLAEDTRDYAWLQKYRPVQRVGDSIRLYYIPDDQ